MSVRGSLMWTALLAASTGAAQDSKHLTCDDRGWAGWGWDRARACEVRELDLPAAKALSIDARANGGIQVSGESRRDVHVRARVDGWAENKAEAERIVKEVVVRSDGVLRADGPDHEGRSGWSVSYEVLTPRDIDLSLEAQNGGITVADVRGELTLETTNGGIRVDGLAGHVRGRTTNGGVDATLSGEKWDGSGLDLATTNGGVKLSVPKSYSARLETSTVNGHVDVDFPVTVQGRIGREISTTLGNGGALVRAATTNGGVHVSRR